MRFFHFLNFVMNFLKGVVSVCHSFRSMGQPGRISGFDRCFQVVDLWTARRHRVTPMLAKTQILKFYRPHIGKQKPFKGITEPRLGIIEPLLEITKLAEGINKPYLGENIYHCPNACESCGQFIRTNLLKGARSRNFRQFQGISARIK